MKNSIKNHVEIDGAIITPEVIERLKHFQENGNDGVTSCREIIADSICLLTLLLDHYDHEPTKAKAIRAITDLSYLRDYFDELKKP